jgi:hypothetical protein
MSSIDLDLALPKIFLKSTITDVEGRRLRKWRGLDTPVAWADNDECHRLALGWTINESGSTPPQE